MAGLFGYLCYHTHDSRRSLLKDSQISSSRKTAQCCLPKSRPTRALWTNDQIGYWLHETHGVIWRPKHWEVIEICLSKTARAYETEPILGSPIMLPKNLLKQNSCTDTLRIKSWLLETHGSDLATEALDIILESDSGWPSLRD